MQPTSVTFMDGPLALTRRVLRIDATIQHVSVVADPEPVAVEATFDPLKTVRWYTYDIYRFVRRPLGAYAPDTVDILAYFASSQP